MCPITFLRNRILDAISDSNSDVLSMTISDFNPKAICHPISIPSHCSSVLQVDGLQLRLCEAVSKHLCSRYIAEVDLSICSHLSSKILDGPNVCNCCSAADSVLDVCDLCLLIGEHMRDCRDAEHVPGMPDLCECHSSRVDMCTDL